MRKNNKKKIRPIKIKRICDKNLAKRNKLMKKVKIKKINNPVEDAIQNYNKINSHNFVNAFTNYETIKRVTLNYIRHCHSNYDRIAVMHSKIGESYCLFKTEVNEKILQLYGKDFIKDEVSVLQFFGQSCTKG